MSHKNKTKSIIYNKRHINEYKTDSDHRTLNLTIRFLISNAVKFNDEPLEILRSAILNDDWEINYWSKCVFLS